MKRPFTKNRIPIVEKIEVELALPSYETKSDIKISRC